MHHRFRFLQVILENLDRSESCPFWSSNAFFLILIANLDTVIDLLLNIEKNVLKMSRKLFLVQAASTVITQLLIPWTFPMSIRIICQTKLNTSLRV